MYNTHMSNQQVPSQTQSQTQSKADQLLHRVFGYSSFRGEQQAIVEHIVAGGDALVLMGNPCVINCLLYCAQGLPL